jgi:hypothetical protein
VLYSEFAWAWQGSPYREAIDGRWGFVEKGRMRYQALAHSYDGSVLRTYEREAKGAMIRPEGRMFSIWRDPLFLSGIGFDLELNRNLDALLGDCEIVPAPETTNGVTAVRGQARLFGQDCEITVWIDPAHGWLPKRIEVFEKARRFVSMRIVNDQFAEAAPGVWIVARGEETNYYVDDIIFPPGVTRETVKDLDPAAAADVLARSITVAKRLGLGTQTYVLDPRTVRVNQPIDAARFRIEFPEGTTIFDSTHQPPLKYKQKAATEPKA